MRAVHPAAQALREKGKIFEVPMLYVEARNRATNTVDGIGFWAGPDHQSIAVMDLFTGVVQTRKFYMGLYRVSNVRYQRGLDIRPISVQLSSIPPAALKAFREYDTRWAKVHAYKRIYNRDTMEPVAVETWFPGYIEGNPISRPATGDEGSLTVKVVSTVATLSVTSPIKKSDAVQRKRNGDRIRRYKRNVHMVDQPWGQEDG